MKNWKLAAGLLLSVALPSQALATELEVTHWWTSGGEAAAVAELAKAFDASGDKWVDGAIAGGGDTARPVMIARITGGDPMGATQFNHGQQALELVQAGLMLDLTDVAEAQKWRDVVNPISLLDGCTIDGKVYCAPMNIHSPEWLWINNKIYEDLGIPIPTNWTEFVASAPQVEAAGKIPLALGRHAWQSNLAFNAIAVGVGGLDLWKKVNVDKDMEAAAGPEMLKVFQASADARKLATKSTVQDWN
ncbi:MAG: ABC transporter substrate-binding protein, partial [Rhodobacterales bacterium 17-64-5]